MATFIQLIKTIPDVVNVSKFRPGIVNRDGGTTDVVWQGKSPDDKTSFTDIAGGYREEGRSYSTAFGSDNDKVVLNEAAVKAMGLKDAIGKKLLSGEIQSKSSA